MDYGFYTSIFGFPLLPMYLICLLFFMLIEVSKIRTIAIVPCPFFSLLLLSSQVGAGDWTKQLGLMGVLSQFWLPSVGGSVLGALVGPKHDCVRIGVMVLHVILKFETSESAIFGYASPMTAHDFSIYVINLGSVRGRFIAKSERLTKDNPVELEVGQSLLLHRPEPISCERTQLLYSQLLAFYQMSVCHLLQIPMMKMLSWHTIQYFTAMVIVNLTYYPVPKILQEVPLVQVMISVQLVHLAAASRKGLSGYSYLKSDGIWHS